MIDIQVGFIFKTPLKGIYLTTYIFIFTSFMIHQDILHKSKNYFSFNSHEECRAFELLTMKEHNAQNCLKNFTPYPTNKTDQIMKGLNSEVNV